MTRATLLDLSRSLYVEVEVRWIYDKVALRRYVAKYTGACTLAASHRIPENKGTEK